MNKNKKRRQQKNLPNEYSGEFMMLSVDKLVKASWNYRKDNEKLKKGLLESIKKYGVVNNLIVRLIDKKYKLYEVVNGNHRLDVVKELGMKKVLCYNLGEVDDNVARLVGLSTNELALGYDESMMYELLLEIKQKNTDDDMMGIWKALKYSDDEFMKNAIKQIDIQCGGDKDEKENGYLLDLVKNKKTDEKKGKGIKVMELDNEVVVKRDDSWWVLIDCKGVTNKEKKRRVERVVEIVKKMAK